MRIIAGKLGGRPIYSPKTSKVHPMSEQVRGAIFNVLGDIDGLSLLDGFAGSGAISLEAVSRGAEYAVAIDQDRNAQRAIITNIAELKLNHQIKLIKANAGSWANTNGEEFDLVVLDPPYHDIQPNLLERLAAKAKAGGVITISLPPTADFHLPASSYEQLSSKNYGDATLTFYRRIS